jgi:Zn-dependent M28 family amino/carboxypeptidase
MFNFDMVGRLHSESLQLLGLKSSRDWRRLVDSANVAPRLPLFRTEELSLPGSASDHHAFFSVGVPVIHFTTGLHSDYHTKDDTVDRIDIEGMLRVVDFAERLIRLVGDWAGVPRKDGRV